MIIYNGGRVSGKTTKAIEYVKSHPRTILIVRNQQLADDIKKEHDIEVRSAWWFKSIEMDREKADTKFFIDDIEDYFDNRLEGLTSLAKVEQLKTYFYSAESLRGMINRLGIEQFNKDFPEWSIG